MSDSYILFQTLEESEIADYMKKELWIKEKFAVSIKLYRSCV